ncbi:MAG TPA: asparagine synthase (glutamine-hydrolyzing) [Vicinamibacterales bacterium]|nr:asparagine synthase (glutamine-hydrolyzing) [Vicinamibacterales bacterium]
MCGLTGFVNLDRHEGVDRAVLTRMTDRLVHRGPDSCGYFVEDNVGLGFRRLSIIDLQTGDQPIYSEDRSLVLLCNGEIFNYAELRDRLRDRHVFRTNSDVEVILHLYEEHGVELLQELNGQFAFVLYDRRKRTLFLARDHFGVAPLFYTLADGVFVFGSEIKAILEHPMVRREVDLTGLDQVLSFPGLVSPRTMFKGIESLKSGHYVTLEDSRVAVRRYWDLDYPRMSDGIDERPERYYASRVDELLLQSVRYRLQADVPVGFYLSGGLDSSLIAALIKRASPEVTRHSFSIAFSDENRELSEKRFQQMMVESNQSIHHELMFDWSEIQQRLPGMIYHCECPVRETYNTCSMALSRATKKNGITVVLTGEGSDETFGGYIGYRFDQAGLRAERKHDLDSVLEDELRERLWGDRDLFYEQHQYALRDVKQALYSAGVNECFEQFDCTSFELVDKEQLRGRHPLHQRSYLDYKLRLADHLLSDHGDRMALAHAVEARYPFLDINLVQFAREIPPGMKVNGLTEKYIIKKVAEGQVPREIIDREKFGFRAPGSPYLLQQNIEWVNDMLSPGRIKRQGYFNPDTIERLKTQYSRPGSKINPHLESDWLLIVLTFGILLDTFDLPSRN